MLTLSFGDGSHLGVPCRGALLGRVQREEGKQVRINIQKAAEYLERSNQISPKSSSLQGMNLNVNVKMKSLKCVICENITRCLTLYKG